MAAKIKHSKAANAADPSKAHLASVKRNTVRVQPGLVENDATTGQRVIHPAANPQQVNPIGDAAHEKAAVAEAKILLDKKSTHRQKIAATEKSNAAQRAATERIAAKKTKTPRRTRRARAAKKTPRRAAAAAATPAATTPASSTATSPSA